MPAVKADAYGHGAALVAEELNAMGIGDFCVATVREGVELRRGGIRGTILILGYTHPSQWGELLQWDLTQTVLDYDYAQSLSAWGRPVRVHIGIDTGMHRLGERCENLGRILKLFQAPNLIVEGIFTHLCVSDEETREAALYTKAQGKAFWDVVEGLKGKGVPIPHAHILNSGGLMLTPELGGDYARIGIALYGLSSARGNGRLAEMELRPVLSLKARVASVRRLQQGERAGYGLAFSATRETTLAALSIGYGDGLPRSLSQGVGHALIHGRKVPIAGRVCMDQTLVDVTGAGRVRPGDEAVLIGRSGGEEITAYDLAEESGTISNEILCRLGARLERTAI